MKKIKKVIFSLTVLSICFLSFIFAGCGVTPLNKVQSVRFVSEKYEVRDDGIRYAVFEADLNREIELKIKLTPSSWSGYQVKIQDHILGDTDTNKTRINRRDNKVVIREEEFEYATYKVSLDENRYDYCVVYLKKYPTGIGLLNEAGDGFIENPKIYLPIGSSIKLEPYGLFGDQMKRLVEGEYNYELSSNNPTAVKVEDSKLFTISAVKQSVGKTTVVFKLKNQSQEDKFEFSVDVFVIENASASQSFTYIYGTDKFLTNNSNITVDKTTLEVEDNFYLIGYENYLFSSAGNYVFNEQAIITCNSQSVVINNSNKTIKLSDDFISGTLEFIVWCPTTNNQNNTYTFSITII